MLLAHLFVLEELGIGRFRHTQRLDEVRVCGHVQGFSGRKTKQHHAHFRLGKVGQIVLYIATGHVHITLSKEAEDVGKEVFFFC